MIHSWDGHEFWMDAVRIFGWSLDVVRGKPPRGGGNPADSVVTILRVSK